MSTWIESVREALVRRDLILEPGLSSETIESIEQDLGFRFPPDLRQMLTQFVPSGPGFPAWQNHDSPEILDWLDRPAEEIEIQVLEDGLWLDAWGERPEDDEDAAETARANVARAPVLIPVWDDCYLPATPAEPGNPIISVTDTGVSIVAPDLAAFLIDSLELETSVDRPGQDRSIDFWSALAAAGE